MTEDFHKQCICGDDIDKCRYFFHWLKVKEVKDEGQEPVFQLATQQKGVPESGR